MGDVNITILDGASNIVVPSNKVQVVLGCAAGGTPNTIYASADPNALKTALVGGALVEAAALTCRAGGTVLAIPVTQAAAGTASAVTSVGIGTSIVTVTVDATIGAYDVYYVQMKVVTGGTIGTAGILLQISLDAGRNYGPQIALGAANSYAIAGTGLTLHFGIGTLLTGGVSTFGTVAPSWNTAGILAALNALRASPYGTAGWGSMHIVGIMGAADAATIEGYLDTYATNYLYTRAIVDARDASPAVKWGGTAEPEATWYAALQTDYAATSAKRIAVGAGHYNMPSAFPTAAAGAPSYRRPLGWAAAARAVTIPPQRHLGRVRDGSLSQIVTSPTVDPTDGFVYHDEFITPALTTARFMAARTRVMQPGWFVDQPNLMSPAGSDFTLKPYGNVIDIAAGITYRTGSLYINSDVRLNANGTIYENEARAIEGQILGTINVAMTSQHMISSAAVVVNRSTDVSALSKVALTVTIVRNGYILSEDISIGFSNSLAA